MHAEVYQVLKDNYLTLSSDGGFEIDYGDFLDENNTLNIIEQLLLYDEYSFDIDTSSAHEKISLDVIHYFEHVLNDGLDALNTKISATYAEWANYNLDDEDGYYLTQDGISDVLPIFVESVPSIVDVVVDYIYNAVKELENYLNAIDE